MCDEAIATWPVYGQWYPAHTRRYLTVLPDQSETVAHLLHRQRHSAANRVFHSHLAQLVREGVLEAESSVADAAGVLKILSKSGELPYRQR